CSAWDSSLNTHVF
nr:immunoglobulin light chain junction region [Macaca mulatta]MPO12092.1 immunoglobulin light chain junction region [Macaca mulatta]MPO13420.1 immunoglobulin light chain junction region [Macaca mulatta]